MLFQATIYSSAQILCAIKDVTCENCQARFAYEMVRRGTGEGTSIYGLDNQGAADRAAERAQLAIQKLLVEGEDFVACPACGHFQESMVDRNATRYWYWSPWGTGNRINPNKHSPRVRGSFPGTPTAVLLQATDQGVPAGSFFQRPPDIEPDDILSIRMYQGEFPPCCCICFKGATTVVDVVPEGGINPAISVPACLSCVEERRRRKWRRTIGAFLVVAVPLALAWCFFIMSEEGGGDVATMFGGSVMATLAGLIAAVVVFQSQLKGLPVAIVRMDWETLICRMKFFNTEYRHRVRSYIGRLPLTANLLRHIAGENRPPELPEKV